MRVRNSLIFEIREISASHAGPRISVEPVGPYVENWNFWMVQNVCLKLPLLLLKTERQYLVWGKREAKTCVSAFAPLQCAQLIKTLRLWTDRKFWKVVNFTNQIRSHPRVMNWPVPNTFIDMTFFDLRPVSGEKSVKRVRAGASRDVYGSKWPMRVPTL